VTKRFQTLLGELSDFPQVLKAVNQEGLGQLLLDALGSLATDRALVEAVMHRHKRVQQQKRKSVWIEQDHPHWILMPVFGDNSDTPQRHGGAYLHPFRVSNAYSLLSDLGSGGLIFFGLGITFAVLALLPSEQGKMRWAWIPAIALVVIGLLITAAAEEMLLYLGPAALILGGIFILLRAFSSRR
jgi:hypothetical protein